MQLVTRHIPGMGLFIYVFSSHWGLATNQIGFIPTIDISHYEEWIAIAAEDKNELWKGRG